MPARPERAALLFALLLLGCAPAPTESPAQATEVRALSVIFRDAVVYAGATHYYFERLDGEPLQVIELNDAGEIEIENADMLIDPNPDEGPPGANPAWVGKTVTLHYDGEGRVVAVMPAYE